jgi:hypothetical protein
MILFLRKKNTDLENLVKKKAHISYGDKFPTRDIRLNKS